jgi:hypothetical protein
MTQSKIRQEIEYQLDQLPTERLTLVNDFLKSIQTENSINQPPLRKLSPIKRGKRASDLLKYTGTWQGDDFEDCLNFVRETRAKTEF